MPQINEAVKCIGLKCWGVSLEMFVLAYKAVAAISPPQSLKYFSLSDFNSNKAHHFNGKHIINGWKLEKKCGIKWILCILLARFCEAGIGAWNLP